MDPILYFDIDGVLLSYDDEQRPLLCGGALQDRLWSLGFQRLVCVSGWCDLLNAPVLGNAREQQKSAIHAMLEAIFPDRCGFLRRLELAYATDQRCQHIDLSQNWFYLDDWADQFFQKQFGLERYRQEANRRILCVDPHGDGSDILHWLDQTVAPLVPA